MKKFLFVICILLSFTLASCTKQEVNRGLYALPAITLCLAIWKFRNVSKAYHQGETKQQLPSGPVITKRKTIPIGELVYGLIFLAATLVGSLLIYSENRNYDQKKDGVPKEAPKDNRESAEKQAGEVVYLQDSSKLIINYNVGYDPSNDGLDIFGTVKGK